MVANILALNNCFSYRNVVLNGVQLQKHRLKWRQRFVKNRFKKPDFFVKKLKISYSLDHTILFKFH